MLMAEKIKHLDGIMLRRGLSKFDASLLSTDGGKYSPSIRKLRQHCLHDAKYFSDKNFLSPPRSTSTLTKHIHKCAGEHPLSPSNRLHSPIDLMQLPLKCDHCQKNEGLFQCSHCNQRLCIRCCNKHYKKVTTEYERLHELSNRLLTKIIHKKRDLEKQKNDIMEQCHKWRVDTINNINQAHKHLLQTIYDEYELLEKECDLFVEKQMPHINIDETEFTRIQKGNLGSFLLSPSTPNDTIKSKDMIKKRIEILTKHMFDIEKFSFHVQLPTFDNNDNIKVESHYIDGIRCTNAIRQNKSYTNHTKYMKESSFNSEQTLYEEDQTNSSDHNHCSTKTIEETSSSINENNVLSNESIAKVEDKANNDNNSEQTKTSMQTCDTEKSTAASPLQLLSTKDNQTSDCPWLDYRTYSTLSFIQ